MYLGLGALEGPQNTQNQSSEKHLYVRKITENTGV